jgi:Ras GTPase-activating-like protein IQGAP2/3
MASIIAALKKRLGKEGTSGTEDALLLDEEKLEQELLRVQQELRSLKSEISQQCRRNYELDKDLSRYDSKIAHLIHHRITLEEFEEYVDESRLGSMPGSLEDAYQQQLFGSLFFLLQACPLYLAKLTREVSMKEIDSLLQPVMFSLYGNQYEDREECLLLSMFEQALMMEFQAARDMNSLMRANTAITRMMTTYTRRGPGMKYVKQAMGDLIHELVDMDVSMEINPLQIYQTLMDNEEVPDPGDSTLLTQLAESNPIVQKKVQENLKQLEHWAMRIFLRLKETIDLVPYGIRWLCKAIRVLVKEKFPEASAEYCQSLIGGFFILRLINPAIVTPQLYHLHPNPPSSKVRRNLTLLAKMIQKLGNVGNVRESYMKPLEGFVLRYKDEFKTFLSDLSDVDEFHEILQMEEYMALSRKDLFIEISPKEIQLIQSLLTKYNPNLVTSEDDVLLDLLHKLPLLSDEDAASTATIRIALVNMWSDTHVATGTGMKFVSLEDSVDEVSSSRGHCVSLLTKLGSMVSM